MLYILTPIFCAGLCLGTVFSFSNNGKVYAADTPVKQSAGYLDLSGSGNILNGFEGAQNEYVYFGTNNGNAVQWRVLAKNDSKYGDGNNNLLLWADKQIAAEAYNTYGQNPDYAYWSTSRIRASLNGGFYYNAVSGSSTTTATPMTTTLISESQSWYSQLFSVDEKNAVKAASRYTTDCWGSDSSLSQYKFQKEAIVTTSDGANGKYNRNRINATSHPTSQFATVNGTSVYETTVGDKLFLLDYYDVNNLAYGFGDDTDSDGVIDKTYANKISSGWNNSSNWYPSYYDGAGKNFNNISSNYLKFSGEASDYYWLRPAGRSYTVNSGALFVSGGGYIVYSIATDVRGVRPAMNLDTTNIGYVTAKVPNGTWADMSDISANPVYKVYYKDTNYVQNTPNARATIGVKDGTLNIKYNNPTGTSTGTLLVILSDKSATDGSVAYQITVSMDSSATVSTTALANVALPAGVSLSNYNVSLLYTSANGGNMAESIYCSYTIDDSIAAPQNFSVTFNEQKKWLSDLKGDEKPNWLDTDIYCNEVYVSIESIKYSDVVGEKVGVPVTKDQIIDAGTYVVTMKSAEGTKWTGDNESGKTKVFTITVKQGKPNVTPKFKEDLPNPLYISYNDGKLPDIVNGHDKATPGKLEWQSGEKPDETKSVYYWQFTPGDENDSSIANNYESITETSVTTKIDINYKKQSVKNLEIVLHKDGAGEDAENVKIYDAYTLKDGDLSLKKFITVYAVKEDGVTKVVLKDDEFDLELEDGSDKLTAGSSATLVAINKDGKSGMLKDITVLESKVVGLLASYKDNGTHLKYSDKLSFDDVKKNLTVRAQWNYSGDDYVEVKDKSKITLTGDIK
ncbi:MAG: hypothetical protein K2J61_05230, partial [Clostridia bacterium]|nr:hypothetical protein [Clostridia bacterium]